MAEFSERFVTKLSSLLRAFYALDEKTREKEYEIWEAAVDNLLEEEERDFS